MKEGFISKLLGEFSVAIHSSEDPALQTEADAVIPLESSSDEAELGSPEQVEETSEVSEPKKKPKKTKKEEVLVAKVVEEAEITPLEESPKKRLSKRLKLGLAAGIPAVLLLAFFITPNLIYKNKILPKTSYAEVSLSSSSPVAKQQIDEAVKDFKFNLDYQNETKQNIPADLGFGVDTEKTAASALGESIKLRFWQKPFALFKSHKISSVVKYDQQKLKDFLKNNYSDGQLPEDAKIEFSADVNEFVIKPEVSGLGVDSKKLATELESRISNLDSSPLTLKIDNVDPELTTENLSSSLKTANSYLTQKV